jgi:hypothetical protein
VEGDIAPDPEADDRLGIGKKSVIAGFDRLHEPAVADHIGGKSGGKPAFQALSPLLRRLTITG